MDWQDDRLESLLDKFEEREARGEGVKAEDLCHDCPELVSELDRRIERLKAVNRALDITPVDSAQAAEPADESWQVDDGEPLPAGRFRPDRFHAKGGLGEVFLALDTELGRVVALKRMQPQQARLATNHHRFEQEARLTGRLEHPGVVPIYGLGHDSAGHPVYAMRFIRGETLAAAIDEYNRAYAAAGNRTQRVAMQQLLRQFLAVCQTVAYAHSQGIVHRDIKPQNIMLGKFGETLLVDWGLAKSLGADDEDSADTLPALAEAEGKNEETIQGAVKGSPAYMSPEQAEGDLSRIGRWSDVYGLGATLYQVLVGKAPFSGNSHEILDQVRRGAFPAPRTVRPRTPRALEAICLKAMDKAPERRYASAQELADDVVRWLADEPVQAWK
ncbi:MAG: serine/threonine protein kinase, partial [Planctomycetales bacterium]|nr:serine/threonine protein kinase [Planctomycetales bacterium]